jgi:putative acetyltransferase
MLVRQETPADSDAVRRVHVQAFARPGPGGPVPPEAPLVEELRQTTAFLPDLSLVALIGPEVVGHVMSTRATLGPGEFPVLGLGPLGVLPAHQGRGVGIALMEASIALVDQLGESMIVLLGDPGYYRRFGFESASDYGIEPPDPGWAPHFQVLTFGAYDPRQRGRFTYAEPFDRV